MKHQTFTLFIWTAWGLFIWLDMFLQTAWFAPLIFVLGFWAARRTMEAA